jgi:hypothetical protein
VGTMLAVEGFVFAQRVQKMCLVEDGGCGRGGRYGRCRAVLVDKAKDAGAERVRTLIETIDVTL